MKSLVLALQNLELPNFLLVHWMPFVRHTLTYRKVTPNAYDRKVCNHHLMTDRKNVKEYNELYIFLRRLQIMVTENFRKKWWLPLNAFLVDPLFGKIQQSWMMPSKEVKSMLTFLSLFDSYQSKSRFYNSWKYKSNLKALDQTNLQ